MRLGRILAVILLIGTISSAVAPRATADPPRPRCQPYVPITTNVLPPELSNPPIPHSGDPRIKTMCIRSKSAAPAQSPVEFWCTLVVWPPASEVGGLFVDAAAGVVCDGPILGMNMTQQIFEVIGQTQEKWGQPVTYFAVGPVIWGAITAACAFLPWDRIPRVMINTAFAAIFAINPDDDGSIVGGTFDEPQTLVC